MHRNIERRCVALIFTVHERGEKAGGRMAAVHADPVVHTPYGAVRGRYEKGVAVFRGIPVWLALGLVTWFAARSKEKDKEPPPLYREVLSPGESISIRILEPPR